MTTSNIQVPAEARTLLIQGMKEACKADGLKRKADKATAGASTLLTEAAIACGSGEAFKLLIDGYYAEVRANVGGAATAIGATKGKNGEYLIPPVARTVVSELMKAFTLGTSLFEMETDEEGNETDVPTDKPRTFRKVRAANKAAADAAEASAIQQANPRLHEMLVFADSLKDSVTAFRANVGWLLENSEAPEAVALMESAVTFEHNVSVVAALAIAAQREAEAAEKAEAEAEAKAGDTIAEAEANAEAEAKPEAKPSRKRATK